MNINMKYYIVTIGAIFIALGVGILVGFNLNYDQALSKQQSEVLESFNTEFDDLKNKNKNLQSEIDNLNGDVNTLKSYVDKNVNGLTVDALTDKNTGIILTSENYDYSEELEELITNANGTVSFNIVIKDNISDEDKLARLSKDLSKVPPVCPSPLPDILATGTPQAAIKGAKAIVVLSPTPPVECLSTFTPFIADKSITSPEFIIASVR